MEQSKTIEEIRIQYLEVIGREVSSPKKNDAEWMESKITAFKEQANTVTTDSVVSNPTKTQSKVSTSYSIKHYRVEFIKDWESFGKGDRKLLREDLYNKAKSFVKILK